jgi:hypothetical protein
MITAIQVHEAVFAVCPIVGVSIGNPANKKTWRIDFADGATDAQKAAAQAAVDAFDLNATPPATFLAREFFALLTVADFTAIRNAVTSNDALGLLWASLQAQGEAPINTTAERFLAGWAGLKQALPAARSAAIASALGIPNA